MRGRAFVAPGVASAGHEVTLDAEESHYLVRVRRCAVGDAVQLLDGEAKAHAASIVRADPRACTVAVERELDPGPPLPVDVLVGIVDPKAMLEAITAACEAGAARLVPVRCERAQPTLPSAARVERVLRAAQRQCGRALPLRVTEAVDLDAVLDGGPPWDVAAPDDPAPTDYLAHPGAAARGLLPGPARVLVGPEGGLSAAEIQRATSQGFIPIGLSRFVLRTPTAVVAALARFA